MKRNDAVVTGLLAFPLAIAALAMVGFAFGVTIGGWHMPVALVLSLALAWRMAEEDRLRIVGWIVALLFVSFLFAGLSVSYTYADADAYHRPATILLANGWNPLRQTEVDEISGLMGGGFRSWHVAFLPRLAWLLGAACYWWFGFVEIADAVNFILFFASILSVRLWLRERFGLSGWRLLALTMAICISPVVIGGVFGGLVDAGGYSAFVVAAVSADRKKMLPLVLSVVAMSGLKFTGAVIGALVFIVYAAFDLKEFKKWFAMGLVAGILTLLINATPYLTSFWNHGGPFYPSHSFVKSERFEEDGNPITNDFGLMNDDAKELGYFGRFAWAYVSQGLVKAYYAQKTGRADFNPEFRVNGGVGGFGAFFRCLFIVSLAGWCLVRNRSIHAWLALIIVSVLMQPTFYSGYARYVPQFYLFPWLVMLGLSDRFQTSVAYRRTRWIGWGALGAYAVSLLAYPASFFALQWIVSVQTLQLVRAAQHDLRAVTVSSGLYGRIAYGRDIGLSEDRVSQGLDWANTDGLRAYKPYFSYASLFLNEEPNDFYKFNHIVSADDPDIKASRGASYVRFFTREFLPRELPRIPLRLWQTICLRAMQFMQPLGYEATNPHTSSQISIDSK